MVHAPAQEVITTFTSDSYATFLSLKINKIVKDQRCLSLMIMINKIVKGREFVNRDLMSSEPFATLFTIFLGIFVESQRAGIDSKGGGTEGKRR